MNYYGLGAVLTGLIISYYIIYPGGYWKWKKRKSEMQDFKKSKGKIDDELKDDEVL